MHYKAGYSQFMITFAQVLVSQVPRTFGQSEAATGEDNPQGLHQTTVVH